VGERLSDALSGGHRNGPMDRCQASRQCLLCGGTDCRVVFRERGIDILRCRGCRHVWSSYLGDPHYAGFWGDQVAQEEHIYWNNARQRMHQDFFDRFVADRSGRLLDMGCGLGFFLKRMAAYPAWDAYGCEISVAAVRYAQETLQLKNVVCARPEEAPWPAGFFDAITMWDVVDHIPHPDMLLRHCHDPLARDGVCFIRTPNISMHLPRARLKKLVWGERADTTYLQPRDHFHHYSSSALRALLARNGFSRVDFVHLHAIESASSKRRMSSQLARSLWFHTARGLAALSRGRVNIDNLYAVARK
jgi:2-polyprenyl-3-methyl-5-hydroxy-6-metoxy-1,4-benzoquinol methylase